MCGVHYKKSERKKHIKECKREIEKSNKFWRENPELVKMMNKAFKGN